MNELERIVDLLADPSIEKRIAAAIVLGELRPKGAEVVDGLVGAAQSEGLNVLQRHALEALAKIGSKKAALRLFPLLGKGAEDVRRAAAHAIAAAGDEVVPQIRERLKAATDAEERRALDAILAELGGKDAFSALLAGLASSDANTANTAAIAVRQQLKTADARARKSYLGETERFLKQQKKSGGSAPTVAAAIKILGYLEDEKTIETLLEYAGDETEPPAVRQEAVIALRFAIAKKSAPEVAGVLIAASAAEDRTLAQTALRTLGGVALTAAHARKLEQLIDHPEIERARFVIEQLGRQKDLDAAKILVGVLGKSDKKRAELAAQALAGHQEAAPLLAKALLENSDPDRAWLIRRVLQPHAKKLTAPLKKQIVAAAAERLGDHQPGWEALLEVARDADPDAAGEALRELAAKLKRSKDKEKALPVLAILAKSGLAAPEDTYALASLELGKSSRDVRPGARAQDDSLRLLGSLVHGGFDILAALRKDKSLELDALYYVGFHFIEEGQSIGSDLLEEVVKRGGRTKIAKMAKNKLALAEAS